MKVKVYASIVVDEVEVSAKEYDSIMATFTNAIPDKVFDQVEDALGGNATLIGISVIESTDGECCQEY